MDEHPAVNIVSVYSVHSKKLHTELPFVRWCITKSGHRCPRVYDNVCTPPKKIGLVNFCGKSTGQISVIFPETRKTLHPADGAE